MWCVACITLTPIVTNGIGKNVSGVVEGCSGDGSPNGWVTLQSMLGNSVPEMERAVGASSAEGAVDGVERYRINGVDIGHVV